MENFTEVTIVFSNNYFENSKFASNDELLQQLLRKWRSSSDSVSEQKSMIEQMSEIILRSRPIARPFRQDGKSLRRVYQELYQQLQQQICQNLESELLRWNNKTVNINNWKNRLLQQVFKQILDDGQLKQLGLEAQAYPAQSELRSYALTELIRAIQLSGRLCRPHREVFHPSFYQLIYEEAVGVTLSYVCLNIDLYDPNRGKGRFMNWVNFRLDRAVIECRRKFSPWEAQELSSLKDLDAINPPRESPLLSELIYQCIQEDDQKVFQHTHIKHRSDANFRAIALAKFAGQTWEQIAENFNLPVPTVSGFYQRCCRKFAPLLKQQLQS